jgi:hypothetical protein
MRVSTNENVIGMENVRNRVGGISVRVGENVIEGIGEKVRERQEQRVGEFAIVGECES